jgi:hypothetical protein
MAECEVSNVQTGAFALSGNLVITDSDNMGVYLRTGKDDFTGSSHGDELKTSYSLLIDDVDITSELSGDFDFKYARRLNFNQISTLHETSDDGIDPIAGHPQEATRTLALEYDVDKMVIDNQFVWNKTLGDIFTGYICVICAGPDYINEVTDELGNTADLSTPDDQFYLFSNGKELYYTNSGNSDTITVLASISHNADLSILSVWNKANHKKGYLNVTDGGDYPNVAINDVWTSRQIITSDLTLT